MDELSKIRRVLGRINPEAPHDVLLVLDATTGQNALAQVEVFRDSAGVTGLIMTKLDGTARGGILVAAAEKFGLPIHAIGVGEAVDDLRPSNHGVARAIAVLPNDAATTPGDLASRLLIDLGRAGLLRDPFPCPVPAVTRIFVATALHGGDDRGDDLFAIRYRRISPLLRFSFWLHWRASPLGWQRHFLR